MPYQDFRQFLDALMRTGDPVKVTRPVDIKCGIGNVRKQSYVHDDPAMILTNKGTEFPFVASLYSDWHKALFARHTTALVAAGNEVGGIVVLVGTDRAFGAGVGLGHSESRCALGSTSGSGQPGLDDKPTTVFRHDVTYVAELGLFALEIKTRFGVRRGGVCLIRPSLAMEVLLGILSLAAVASVPRLFVPRQALRHEAFYAGLGLDQRSINREVPVRQKLTYPRQVQHIGHELASDVAVEQPIADLAGHRRIPDRVAQRQANKPAKQQIVVELLQQQAFRAHRVGGLQQQCAQRLFLWDQGTAFPRIKPSEAPQHPAQRFIDNGTDGARWMVRRDALLQSNKAGKFFRTLVLAMHPFSSPLDQLKESRKHGITLKSRPKPTFAATC